MSLERILENWSEYDNRKLKVEDRQFFSCEEDWEVNYLIGKIQSVYSWYTRDQIIRAIRSCCAEIRAPRPRKQFVQCVISKL